ncbi:transcriptional regulator [Altererythrobacter arenosus]|uniref:Transcriptional regulator n=1 Tax=Altererythrobacter arenosus TaxID=3032592 RepID=A0ABY8FMP2_9SPHN|nr:transcriptional regulator [Altererythrobacter sp. CAU 1644]WFL76042.1 transcriptional regulator [Altererythrobacter sp. CAU 1644]
MDLQPTVLHFAEFELDLANRQLRRGAEVVELGNRYFDALALLAAHPGELISKDRFMGEVWRGIPVTDEALTQCIRSLRRSLGDTPGSPRFIQTVPKHGYRFVAAVKDHAAEEAANEVDDLASTGGRIAGAATMGGAAAGAIGGVFYGIMATQGGFGSIATVVILTIALAVLGASAIGVGMGAAAAWRGPGYLALTLGGGAGGLAVGALGQVLAQSGISAVTGIELSSVTGMGEGAALGVAAGLMTAAACRLAWGRMTHVLATALFGAGVGAAVVLSGGKLFGRSLAEIEASFPASRIAVGELGPLFGEDSFYMFSQLGTAMMEGALYVTCISWAVQRVLRHSR